MNIPFDKKSFLKYWVIVMACVATAFLVAVFAFQYELTTSDPIFAPIASALLAYFLHLMFWPNEDNS